MRAIWKGKFLRKFSVYTKKSSYVFVRSTVVTNLDVGQRFYISRGKGFFFGYGQAFNGWT